MNQQQNPYQQIVDKLLATEDGRLTISVNVSVSAFRRGIQKVYVETCYANAATDYALGVIEEMPETLAGYVPTRKLVIREGRKTDMEEQVLHLSLELPDQIKSSKFTSKLQFTVVDSNDSLGLEDLGDSDGKAT